MDRNLDWHCISEDVSYVALRKESVDRNHTILRCELTRDVALRKESVDRNDLYAKRKADEKGRSPQGERG